MATSGSVSYSLNGGQIVAKAFKLIGVGREGENLEAEEFADGMEALNLMVRTMTAEGYYLWKKADAVLFPVLGQASYRLGPGGDRCVSTFSETTLADNLAQAAVAISVPSVAGMASGQVIGILMDSGIFHWTTISGTPQTYAVPLALALAGPASSGNTVIAYADLIQRPLRLLDMQRRNSQGTDVPMFEMSREDYRNLTNKSQAGSAIQWYYDPKLSAGVVSLWQPPSDERDTYRFTAYLPLQTFSQSTDDPDCPDEWVETLSFNLAVRLMPSWGKHLRPDDKQLIIQMALNMKQTLRNWDDDPAGYQFTPYPDYSGR